VNMAAWPACTTIMRTLVTRAALSQYLEPAHGPAGARGLSVPKRLAQCDDQRGHVVGERIKVALELLAAARAP